jgi:hypothetical protein
MADVTMCKNEDCKMKNNCYRYIATPDKHSQSYLFDPKTDCENKNYELFIEANKTNEE